MKPSRYALIAMASDFASFLLGQEDTSQGIDRIILFGSVARGDYGAQSDIDLFVDAEPQLEKRLQAALGTWLASKRAQEWRILGVENMISLKVGRLESWPDLHRAIIADGIQLYGKYIEAPKGMAPYLLVSLKMPKMTGSAKVVLSRQLFGYTQKVGKKVYRSSGLVGRLGGQRIARGALMLPVKSAPKLFEILRKRKIAYTSREIWSD